MLASSSSSNWLLKDPVTNLPADVGLMARSRYVCGLPANRRRSGTWSDDVELFVQPALWCLWDRRLVHIRRPITEPNEFGQ